MTAIDVKADRRTIIWTAIAVGLVAAVVVTIMVFPSPFGWIYAIAICGPLFVSIIGLGASLFGITNPIRKQGPPPSPWKLGIEKDKITW